MSSSLLSLPDELLAHIVGEALGEYAPRIYKQRQDTARALCLVNKRVGAIAQGRLVEAMHVPWKSRNLLVYPIDMHHKTQHLLVNDPGPGGARLPREYLPFFHALRDLRLVEVYGVQLGQIGQLAELRNLVLVRSGYSASVPLVAPKLARVTLFFCVEDVEVTEPSRLFESAGCPSVRYLDSGRSNRHDRALYERDFVDGLDHLVLELFDERESSETWTRMNLDGATVDKALFDCMWHDYQSAQQDKDAASTRPRLRR